MIATGSGSAQESTGKRRHRKRKRQAPDGREIAKTIVGRQVDVVLDAAGARLAKTADALRHIGDTMRDAADDPMAGEAADFVASYVQRAAGYFESADSDRVVRDLEWYGRRYPVVVAGAAFAAGLLASRFVKVTSAERFEAGEQELQGQMSS